MRRCVQSNRSSHIRTKQVLSGIDWDDDSGHGFRAKQIRYRGGHIVWCWTPVKEHLA